MEVVPASAVEGDIDNICTSQSVGVALLLALRLYSTGCQADATHCVLSYLECQAKNISWNRYEFFGDMNMKILDR